MPASLQPPASASTTPLKTSSPSSPLASSSPFAAEAVNLDLCDPLRPIRSLFSLPAPVYLCGNSLGPQPLSTRRVLLDHLDKWASHGVAAHFTHPDPWADIQVSVAALVAPLVGARHEEVAVMNSLTVNLHLMLIAFYRPEGKRRCILVEDGAFCSDEYALQSHVKAKGMVPDDVIVRLQPRNGERLLRDQDVLNAIRDLAEDGTLALVLLPGVQYYTGQLFPMREACAVAQELAIPIGFDLAHAVGNVELSLHDWGPDFAVWCSYKYLNSGPGAVAGAFVHERHAGADLPRLAGWWGHDRKTRFAMPRDFVPQRGAPGFQLSNPPVLAIVPVAEAAKLFEKAGGMGVVRRKSVRLTGFFERLLEERLSDAVEVVTPRDVDRRGAQLSLVVERVRRWEDGDMHAFNERLEKRGVVCDVREPDVLRVAPAPLYNSFMDVVRFVEVLEQVLQEISDSG